MEINEQPQGKSWWGRRNWWKIGFFVLLLALEICREIIVIQSDAKAEPNVRFNLMQYSSFTEVTGVWKRTDKDQKMSDAALTIECSQERGECIMVDVQMNEGSVFAPNISTFPAKFTPDSITFEDDRAACVNLLFSIDLRLKKVNALRENKPNSASNEMCGKLEKRIDLTVADSLDLPRAAPDKDHFLPIFSALIAVLKAT